MASFLDGHGGYCTCTRDKCTNECATYRRFKPKPITNADRIRSMTDEELAEFITPVKCVDCRLLDCGVEEEMLNGKRRTCQERVLDWLKQEGE